MTGSVILTTAFFTDGRIYRWAGAQSDGAGQTVANGGISPARQKGVWSGTVSGTTLSDQEFSAVSVVVGGIEVAAFARIVSSGVEVPATISVT